MITEFNTLPKKIYYVQTAEACTVLDPDGEPLAEINAPGGYFPGIGSADATTGTVTFSPAVKRVIGPFDLAPQLQLTLLGVLGGDQLPAGYTRLAYLESTGTQYIDTGVVPRQGPLYRATCDTHYLGPVNRYAPFMSVLGDLEEGYMQRPRLSLGYTNAGSATQTRVLAANEGWNRSKLSINPNLRHFYKVKIRLDDNLPELYFDGEKLDCEDATPGAYIGVIQYPLFLFANNNYGVGPSTLYSWRIFACSLAEDETPKFNFIPALDSTGTPCMFDSVSKTPFYNKGSGAFIAGVETQTQLNNMLRKLPDRTGLEVGTLQVRLADSLQTVENVSKLESVLAKNWEISQAA